MVATPGPIVNVALSGKVDGGLTPGLTVVAGPSKHYKSNLSLMFAASYLKKYEDAVCLLYDTEFGITPEYLMSMGLDPSRVLHTPIEHVEALKFDIVKQLENIERGDKVIIVLDSIGNLASKKEIDDAIDGKSVADMTRAKQIKSLFRMVTPYLTTRDIPMVVINHTIQTMEMFSKQVMTGGTGVMYSANTVIFLGKSGLESLLLVGLKV
jgi:RecA/RadA recombinase